MPHFRPGERMLVSDNVQRQLLELLARDSARQPGQESEQRSAAHLQLNPGQQVKAEIISTLSNHLYLARVAGELFKLEIPRVVQPGQSVPLTLVAVKPRVVFEVRGGQQGGEAVSLSFLGKRLSLPEGGEGLPQEGIAAELPEGGDAPAAIVPDPPELSIPSPTVEEEKLSAAKLQLAPGQQVKGEVVQTLGRNLYLVQVEGETFQLALPAQLKKGDSVSLAFVSSDPQVLFELQHGEGAAEPVRVSSLGRWLAGAPDEEAAPFPVQGPLLGRAGEGGPALAARLKDALTAGGLFYESHLARWAAGALPLAELLKEPQGKLSRLRRPSAGAAERGEGTARGNGVADDRTLPLVREQLLLLNTRVLSWKGEPWAGQEMALTVREAGDEDDPGVEASLALDLPHLGGVRARVHLGAQGTAVEVVVETRESCELLKSERGNLTAASSAAGVRLSRVSVRHEEEGE
ncbi:flagellar hook-length control protein FliK [Geomonas sp. RF6]|uniref:flagellar hook-length control protein FliK n=1 Tax=Geomonas sp. RF6 TaxID=2897342 RepID=UPI001E632EE0|nr:flagellar hook-length control protein FliK [Geomonas sp. RF6]UFS70432.1 flagellar hook-length control protein FliK [Geomonas sp. RF6]